MLDAPLRSVDIASLRSIIQDEFDRMFRMLKSLPNSDSPSNSTTEEHVNYATSVFKSFGDAWVDEGDAMVEGLTRRPKDPLPDPRLLRQILKMRETRSRYFDKDLFADPAWDMILDLAAARAECRRVSVTSLCIASRVPPTTALRWISQLVESGVFDRVEDDIDRRRAYVALSDRAASQVTKYFADCGRDRKMAI